MGLSLLAYFWNMEQVFAAQLARGLVKWPHMAIACYTTACGTNYWTKGPL